MKKEELILNPLLNLTVKKRGKSTIGINLTEESEGKGSDFELTHRGWLKAQGSPCGILQRRSRKAGIPQGKQGKEDDTGKPNRMLSKTLSLIHHHVAFGSRKWFLRDLNAPQSSGADHPAAIIISIASSITNLIPGLFTEIIGSFKCL